MKANYHTHTHRCHHASGCDEAYVKSAIQGGFKELGFSDHTPWKYDTKFVSNMRMTLEDFEDYYASISSLKEKYHGQIEIKIGLECEYYRKYMPWLKDFIQEKKLDYVILGNHYFETDELHIYYGSQCYKDSMLEDYVRTCIEGMKTGIYSYLAHPDLFCRARNWDLACEKAAHRICNAAKENDFILEYNLAGLKMSQIMNCDLYPHPQFWKIAAEYGCKVIIGVDAHEPSALEDVSLYEGAKATLSQLGLEIVESIAFLR